MVALVVCNKVMYGLDLFSGIGGITKALDGYARPIAYCENDRYCQAVLLSRMAGGDIPISPIWDDVKTLDGRDFRDTVDIVYGGFPCQDISVAGRGAGLEGERSGLFFEIVRLVSEIQPRFIFLENVPAIRSRGGARVVGELAGLGYDCRWDVLSAYDVGASHLRERWFLLAYAATRDDSRGKLYAGNEFPALDGGETGSPNASNSRSEDVADPEYGGMEERRGTCLASKDSRNAGGVLLTDESGIEGEKGEVVADAESPRHGNANEVREMAGGRFSFNGQHGRTCTWEPEPNVGRVAHGIPSRVDRLRGLGNAVVPAQAREAFERLIGFN